MKKLLLLSTIASTFSLNAQEIKSSTFELSGDAKRGTLTNLQYDEATGTYKLLYVSPKVVNGLRVVEEYEFDKDFNNTKAETSQKDIDQWKNDPVMKQRTAYKGDVIQTKSIYAIQGLKGGLNLIPVTWTHSWNWDKNAYDRTGSLGGLNNVEPAGGMNNYHMEHSAMDVSTGGALLVSAIIPKGTKDIQNHTEFAFTYFDNSLNRSSESTIKFNDPMGVVKGFPIYDPTNPLDSVLIGAVYIFAPCEAKIAKNPEKVLTGYDKVGAAKTNLFTYVRVNAKGEILNRVDFESKTTDWNLQYMYNTDEDVYLAGPCRNVKFDEKYYNTHMTVSDGFGNAVTSDFQVAHFSGDQLIYLTNETQGRLAETAYTDSGLKKKKVYNGRFFEYMGQNVTRNGDYMIYGVNYQKVDSNGYRVNFDELVCLHFNKDGAYVGIYTVNPKEKYPDFPVPNRMIFSEDEKSFYWILEENAGLKKDMVSSSTIEKSKLSFSYSGSFEYKYKYMLYPRIFEVNLEGDLKELEMPDTEVYYLDNKFPYLEMKDRIVFVGASKSAKTLWFGELMKK